MVLKNANLNSLRLSCTIIRSLNRKFENSKGENENNKYFSSETYDVSIQHMFHSHIHLHHLYIYNIIILR